MKLIGLIGKARVGKDTVAAHLCAEHGIGSYAFADPMKWMLHQAFPEVDFYEGDREAPIDWLGKSPRQLLQTLGTEWGRDCVHPDLWVLIAENECQVAKQLGQSLAVTDVRFHNEADMILRNGGELWLVVRPDATQVAIHISEEAQWDAYPTTLITNDGTFDELHAQIEARLADA